MAILHLLKLLRFYRYKGDVICIDHASMFDWRVVMCGSHIEHYEDTYIEEIRLCVCNMFIIPCLTINLIYFNLLGMGGILP